MDEPIRRSKILQLLNPQGLKSFEDPNFTTEDFYHKRHHIKAPKAIGVRGDGIRVYEFLLSALEEKLEETYGANYEVLAVRDTSFIIKMDEKVVRVMEQYNGVFVNYPNTNPLRDYTSFTSGGREIHAAVFDYIPHVVTQAAEVSALQVALFSEAKQICRDLRPDNAQAKDKEIKIYNEMGAEETVSIKVPVIIDTESQNFSNERAIRHRTYGLNTPEKYFAVHWAIAGENPANKVVRTETHEVFFFNNKELYEVFRKMLGEVAACYNAHVCTDRTVNALYIIATKTPEIEIANTTLDIKTKFSLRLLMEEAKRLLEEKGVN